MRLSVGGGGFRAAHGWLGACRVGVRVSRPVCECAGNGLDTWSRKESGSRSPRTLLLAVRTSVFTLSGCETTGGFSAEDSMTRLTF